jgi:hypothetical protein
MVYCRTERLIISAGAVARRNVSLLLSDSILAGRVDARTAGTGVAAGVGGGVSGPPVVLDGVADRPGGAA